jgi:glycosyltransferase involved in cell wall biosynthesis/SAM-dependent methyltransferase
MRILLLAPNPAASGPVPKHTLLLVDGLVALGCEVRLESWGRGRDDELLWRRVIGRCRDIVRFRRLLKRERFEIMVVRTTHEWRSMLQGVPLLAATRDVVPTTVVQFHGGHSEWLAASGRRTFKLATAALFRLSDAVLVLSSDEARDGQRFYPRGRFRVVSNPFAPADALGERDRNGGPPRLLFVGRLLAEKGIFDLLSAFARISRALDCRLVIAGDGPCAGEVAERVAELGLESTVTVAGYLTGEPLSDAYRAADVFVFPSYWEGFPTVIAEALAAGLPIVTTPIRGMAEHLGAEENALFVAPGDVDGLVQAVQQLLSDAALRERMSNANRRKVHDFAPSVVARDYLDALTEVADSRDAMMRQRRSVQEFWGENQHRRQLSHFARVSTFRTALGGLQEIVDRWLADNPAPRVLDAGCGAQMYVRLPETAHVTGIDIDTDQLERNATVDERIRGDIQSYRFEPASYDLIICWDVLEHVERPAAALENFRSALSPLGLLVLGGPNPLSLKGLVTNASPHWVHRAYYHQTSGSRPFVTHHRKAASPAEIASWASVSALGMEYATLYESPLQIQARERLGLNGRVWRGIESAVRKATLGVVDLAATDFVIALAHLDSLVDADPPVDRAPEKVEPS